LKPSEVGLPSAFKTGGTPSKHLNVAIRGYAGVGKTYTPLRTLSGPVIYLNGDRNNDLMLDRLRRKFNRDIFAPERYVTDYKGEVLRARGQELDDNAAISRTVRDRFRNEFARALESSVRYIVIDQAAWLWGLIRIARWGKLIEIPQILYSQANWEMESYLHMAENTDKVIVWIAHIEEVWKEVIEPSPNGPPTKKRVPTGKFRTDGYKKFDTAMTVIIDMAYDPETNTRTAKIVKGISGMGKSFEGKEITMPTLLAAATGVPETEW